ncbi:putative glycoprotein [Nyavirus midwayense]|uniref:Putative glycoprotein n=1 Tax=Nyavirus midwayense TaxID=644609 RepID=C4NFL0_9MONO|nr:putative glycoprotein [Nyavirus midwayense]ACQ94978.1 putative glycoprotein [Nyavirus midwayense]
MLSRLILLILCVRVCCDPSPSSPLDRTSPMLCPLQGGLSLHALPQPFACRETDLKTEVKIEIFKKNLRLWETTATVVFKEKWRCSMTCYFFGSQAKNYESEERVPLSEEEARLIMSGTCETGRTSGPLTNDEFHEWKDCGCTWTGTTEHEASRCKRQQGTVQASHGGHMFTGLGPAIHCNYSQGSCELPDKQWLFWTPLSEVQEEYISSWKGNGHLLNNHTVVLDTLQEVYSLTGCKKEENWTSCNTTSSIKLKYRKTKSGGGLSQLAQAITSYTSRQKRALWDSSGQVAQMLKTLRSEILSKVAYLAAEIAPTLAKVVPTCQLAVMHERQLRLLATNNPTLYVRAVYDNPFLFGALSGEYIGIWPCLPVLDYELQTQGPINCTRDPPLSYRLNRGGEWVQGYLDLSTNIIKSSSPSVDCKILPAQLTIRDERLFLYKQGQMQEVATQDIKELPFIRPGDPDAFLITWNDTWVYNSTDYAVPDLEGEVYRYLEEKIEKSSYLYQGDQGPVLNQKQGQSIGLPNFGLPFPFNMLGWLNTLIHYSGIVSLIWLIVKARRAPSDRGSSTVAANTSSPELHAIYMEHKDRQKKKRGLMSPF